MRRKTINKFACLLSKTIEPPKRQNVNEKKLRIWLHQNFLKKNQLLFKLSQHPQTLKAHVFWSVVGIRTPVCDNMECLACDCGCIS